MAEGLEAEVQELKARLDRLLFSATGRALLEGAALVIPAGSQRTDTSGVPDGLINVYESGGNTIVQRFSRAAGAWKSVTLT